VQKARVVPRALPAFPAIGFIFRPFIADLDVLLKRLGKSRSEQANPRLLNMN
jgi:hypothetical protein